MFISPRAAIPCSPGMGMRRQAFPSLTRSRPMNKALFLDRDGTINVEVNYLYKPEEFVLIPGILELARAAVQAGYALIVCTNQSGIARGYYSEADYAALTAHMEGVFREAGAPLTAVYHCPHLNATHPDRKPNPGMFLRAATEHGIDMAASLSLGDKERDCAAARAAGVGRNYLLADAAPEKTHATAVVASPAELVAWL